MLNGAPIEFELVKDVPDGGVLFALPALLLLGLLSKSREMFSMPEGFYPLAFGFASEAGAGAGASGAATFRSEPHVRSKGSQMDPPTY
jgi:hypothetical protein